MYMNGNMNGTHQDTIKIHAKYIKIHQDTSGYVKETVPKNDRKLYVGSTPATPARPPAQRFSACGGRSSMTQGRSQLSHRSNEHTSEPVHNSSERNTPSLRFPTATLCAPIAQSESHTPEHTHTHERHRGGHPSHPT